MPWKIRNFRIFFTCIYWLCGCVNVHIPQCTYECQRKNWWISSLSSACASWEIELRLRFDSKTLCLLSCLAAPLLPKLRGHNRERTERGDEPKVVGDYKETLLCWHSRAATHRNSQQCDSRHVTHGPSQTKSQHERGIGHKGAIGKCQLRKEESIFSECSLW